MRKMILSICSAMLLLVACNNNGESKEATSDSAALQKARNNKDTGTVILPDSAAAAAAWEKFMTPGPMHKWLTLTNGEWEADISIWAAPGATPEKTKGYMIQSSAMGGRYVLGKFKSTMMGMPMEGMSTQAYDNGKNLFVATWIDNFGTGIIYMTGTYDSTTRTLNMKGTQTDPVTGKDTDIREEVTMIDNDSYTQFMFGEGPDGIEWKTMEGVYKRKK